MIWRRKPFVRSSLLVHKQKLNFVRSCKNLCMAIRITWMQLLRWQTRRRTKLRTNLSRDLLREREIERIELPNSRKIKMLTWILSILSNWKSKTRLLM